MGLMELMKYPSSYSVFPGAAQGLEINGHYDSNIIRSLIQMSVLKGMLAFSSWLSLSLSITREHATLPPGWQ